MNMRKRLATLSGLALTVCAATLSTQPVSAAPVLGQGTWETTLKARDISGHAVALNDANAVFFYDTQANITWLADMGTAGLWMTWSGATAWASGLTIGGFDDWRLPSAVDSGNAGCDYSVTGGTDCGYNVQTQVGSLFNEWAHLYFDVLGNKAAAAPGTGAHQPGYGLSNTAYFRNLNSNVEYWYGTSYLPPNTDYAWIFGHDVGVQSYYATAEQRFYAAAVRTGDVLVADAPQNNVPEPSSGLLAVLALGILIARSLLRIDARKLLIGSSLAFVAAGPALAQNEPNGNAGTKEFAGLGFGVGISLGFTKSIVTEAELDGNSIIRATKESKRSPRVILESHYFFKGDKNSLFCPTGNTCGHGPFVAIEPGGNNSNAVSAYGLGWMLGFKFKESAADTSSWNIGLGYVARTGVKVLGDGLEVNKPLPANDKLRYKEVSQPGWMLLSSFSW